MLKPKQIDEHKSLKNKLKTSDESTIKNIENTISKIVSYSHLIHKRCDGGLQENLKSFVTANAYIKVYSNYTSLYVYTDLNCHQFTLKAGKDKALTVLDIIEKSITQ